MNPVSLAVVMPAYNEVENLDTTIADFFSNLSQVTDLKFSIVVVNDGSTDNTGPELEHIAAGYFGLVVPIHHVYNQGYGAAVRTGIAAALKLGAEWIFLTDSDGQFKATQVEEFLATALHDRYSLVVGHRTNRADPLGRRISGQVWTMLNRIVNGVRVRDVDCAYKLIHRSTLSGLSLHGEAAAISPELIAKSRVAGARLLQLPVEHFPREFGAQSGTDFRVVLRSLAGMLKLFWELFSAGHRFAALRNLIWAKDSGLRRITILASLISMAATLYYFASGDTLLYPDAIAHQLIARRVIDSPTPGFGQLGGVWLPLPHLLILPLVWSNHLFYNGLAGTILSMLAFVLTARYIYRVGRTLQGRWEHGLAGFAVFTINPNVWYLQSTPMTEMLLLAAMSGALYYLLRWCQTGSWRSLSAASIATLAACLIRYEGWVFTAGELFVIFYVALRKRRTWDEKGRGQASLIFFAFFGVIAIPGWMIWNAAIFSDPFFFQNGAYAKPSLWVDRSDAVIGNGWLSAKVYGIAVFDNLGPVTVVLLILGFVSFLASTRLRPESAAILAPLILLPFFVYALYAGQRPLHIPEVGGDLYNVRFGLIQILPAAVFTAYLAAVTTRRKSASSRLRPLTFTIVALAGGVLAMSQPVTLTEARVFASSTQEHQNRRVAAWLDAHYDGGLVLMESFGNETVTFRSHVPTANIIYEGSNARGGIWQQALLHPTKSSVRWIYIRTTSNPDAVAQNLLGGNKLLNYTRVYHDQDHSIFRSKLVPASKPPRLGMLK